MTKQHRYLRTEGLECTDKACLALNASACKYPRWMYCSHPVDPRWTNVFASVYTCVIDETQWEFTLDYWDGDEFYSQITRVPKTDIIENPEWFKMLWEGMIVRLKNNINKEA